MLVRDIMSKDPTCCTPYTNLDTVAKMMLNHNCGAIPVCDATHVSGLITDRDIICRVLAKGIRPDAVTARDAMSKPAYTVGDYDRIEVALAVMSRREIRRLPVVDDKGVIVGILSLADIAAHLPDTDVADLLRHVSRKISTLTNVAA